MAVNEEFLAELVTVLNKHNVVLGAHMVDPFGDWDPEPHLYDGDDEWELSHCRTGHVEAYCRKTRASVTVVGNPIDKASVDDLGRIRLREST